MRAAKKFSTIECYTNLKEVELEPGSDVLLECMSNLTANEIFDPSGAGKARTEEEILAGVSRLAHQARNLVLVTNEIFRMDTDMRRRRWNTSGSWETLMYVWQRWRTV